MEKVTFKNSRGLNLVGVFHIPKKETKSVIVIAHGFLATKDRARHIKAAETFSRQGFAVLRFDFGGCGESDETSINVEKQVDDLKSAINFVKSKGYKNIGLVGESLGGLTSILAYDKKIKTLVLWAPVTKAKIPTIFKEKKLLEELNKKGFIIHKKDEREFKITKEFFIERESVNQQEILSKIKCPVLIMHGDKDDTVPLEHSKEALQYLPKESKLEIIKGGDHKLDGKIDEIISISLNWFRKYLTK